MVAGHHATSLTLAQPNFHYPIPTSFELTQRGPTDWVCVGPRIIFSYCKYGLPVSKICLESVFNFNLAIDEMKSSWRY